MKFKLGNNTDHVSEKLNENSSCSDEYSSKIELKDSNIDPVILDYSMIIGRLKGELPK